MLAELKEWDMEQMQIEYVPADKIRLNPKNPRLNEGSVESIVKSINAFGIMWPILVRKANNTIIAGNTRYKAFVQLGIEKIPVVFHDKDEVDAKVYAVFDNKSSENTPWDMPKLADLFVEFDQLNVDLDLTGFTPDEIAEIAPATFEPNKSEPQENEPNIITCGNCGVEIDAKTGKKAVLDE